MRVQLMLDKNKIMQIRINPVALKGKEEKEKMISLMGIVKESDKKYDNIEYKKAMPNGKTYGIVKENQNYFIKISEKRNPTISDFNYIGGLENKISESYTSYGKALKQLNLKLMDLNTLYSKNENINLFESDDVEVKSECCDAVLVDGQCSECNGIDESSENYYDANEEQANVEMTSLEESIDSMLLPEKVKKETPKGRLSINRMIDEMDDIIGDVKTKKKVYSLV